MNFQYVILDRDGGIVEISEETYETAQEAEEAALFWIDDPRYGSHEVEEL